MRMPLKGVQLEAICASDSHREWWYYSFVHSMRGIEDSGLRRWLSVVGAGLTTLAMVVLVGRFAGVAPLVTVVPGGPPMAFVT
ncbi:MAG: hypothetical protein ABIR80_20985, partial [Opitutaceae bacterium]